MFNDGHRVAIYVSLLKTGSAVHIMLGRFIRSFPIQDNALMGTKLVVVVEADEDLSLELLPLDAEQAALLLAPKPAGGIITAQLG